MILKVPIGCPGCSVAGVYYKAKKGIIRVPDEDGPELFAHGCVEVIPGDPTDEEIAAAEQAQKDEADRLEKEAAEEAKRLVLEDALAKKAAEEAAMIAAQGTEAPKEG